MWIYTASWGLLIVWTWKKQDCKIGDREVWWRGMWMDLSGHKLCRYLCFTRKGFTCTAERALFIRWTKWCSLTYQLFSPAFPAFAQWAPEQSGCGGWNGGYAWAQSCGFTCTKADLANAIAGCLICQQQRPTSNPLGQLLQPVASVAHSDCWYPELAAFRQFHSGVSLMRYLPMNSFPQHPKMMGFQ